MTLRRRREVKSHHATPHPTQQPTHPPEYTTSIAHLSLPDMTDSESDGPPGLCSSEEDVTAMVPSAGSSSEGNASPCDRYATLRMIATLRAARTIATLRAARAGSTLRATCFQAWRQAAVIRSVTHSIS